MLFHGFASAKRLDSKPIPLAFFDIGCDTSMAAQALMLILGSLDKIL